MAALAMDQFAAANAVRLERKRLLDELRKADKATALARCAELLLACEPAVEGVSLFNLLRACHYLGRDGARRILAQAEISDPNATIASTPIRQAQSLAVVLRAASVKVVEGRKERGR